MVELFWISLFVGVAVVTVSVVALWGASGARLMSWLAAFVGVTVIVGAVIVHRVWGADRGVVSIVSSIIAGIGLAHLMLALILFWFARYLDRHGPSPPSE